MIIINKQHIKFQNIMKHKLLKSLLLLSALVVGMSTAWATDILNESFNISGTEAVGATYNGWTITRCWGGDGSIRLGASSGDKGQIVSPALTSLSGKATMTFEVKKYGSDTGSIGISIADGDGSVSGDISVASSSISADNWTTKTVTIKGGSSTTKIKFLMTSKRMYLKNVRIVPVVPAVEDPEFSVPAGAYTSAQSVVLSCKTDGATIYYTKGDNPADPTNTSTEYTGAITVDATTIIKAIAIKNSDESEIVSARYAIVDHAGTAVDPYDVADAIDYISTLGDATSASDVYVRGIISQIDGYNDQYNSITYWISDDGTTTKQMEVFGGKGLDGANFSAVTDLTVGQTVTVKGKVKKYGEISEFDSNSQIFLQESDLTKTGDINLSMAAPTTIATASNFFTTSSTGAITYSGGNQAVATINTTTGVVTPVAAGSTTITVTQSADVNYKGKSITINVLVAAASLNSTTIVVDPLNGSTPYYGNPKVVDYLINNTYDGTVAAVSDCEAVATVVITQPTSGAGTFTITPKAVGTAIITISAPATATCEAADDVEYTIYVVGPEALITAAPAPVTIWSEGFSKCKSTGGNGDSAFGTNGGSKQDDSEDSYTDVNGWTFSNGYDANSCVKFGGSNAQGYAITPATGATGNFILTFKAAAWTNDKTEGALVVSVEGDGTVSPSTLDLSYTNWSNFVIFITGATAATKIKISAAQKSKNRFFLDNVVLQSGTLITAKLNSYGFGTFCSEYPIDFSKTNAEDQGFTAWRITAVGENSGVITFAQIDEPVAGGAGVFLKGEPNATVFLTSADSNTIPMGLLRGTLAPTYIAQGQPAYGLKGNKFVPIAAESVLPANKAALVLPPPSGGMVIPVKEFTFDFGETPDGIVSPLGETEEGAGAIYNLAGQRLQKMQKGINIVNGKKILK